MTVKRLFLFFILMSVLLPLSAQMPPKFDPRRFEADLEQFIVMRAGLTPAQSAAFFPVYREMRKKQLAKLNADRIFRHVDSSDDKACADAIRRRDEAEIEQKRIQRAYHKRFMAILPASKVYLVLKAEDAFHRQLFKPVGKMQRVVNTCKN